MNVSASRATQLSRIGPAAVLLFALVALGSAATPSYAAGNALALPATQAPDGLRINARASHALTLIAIQRIADPPTAQEFQLDGWQAGYEERLEGGKGARVLIDTFVFATSEGARTARGVWTAGTWGQPAAIPGLPASAQVFQAHVQAPGVPGWDVEVIFRIGRTLVNVDARYPGRGLTTQHMAQTLAAHATQRYNAWIVAHPPS